MRNRPSGRAIFGLFSAFCLTGFAGMSLAAAPEAQRVVVMTGEGSATGMPDQATVSAGFVSQARTADAAVAGNSEVMNRVMAALKPFGLPEKSVHTNGFSLNPQYPPDDQKDPQPHTIIGYEVSNGISVTLDDVTRAGAVLDALIGAGANQSAGVSFSIKNPKPLLSEARTEAAKDALERAQIYAKAVGATLGPVLSIREGMQAAQNTSTIEEVVVTAEKRSTPIVAGEQSVEAEVTVVWALK